MGRNLAWSVALCGFLGATGLARADEGMWTFEAFPSAAVRQAYGVVIDQTWLDHVRVNAIRLSSGCSASVVSGQGLALTNHHCVSDCAQALSGPGRDYLKDGFAVMGRSEERTCPGMQAEILQTSREVTDEVLAAAGKGQDFGRARDAEIARIEDQACAGGQLTRRCQVVGLYQGGRFMLYTFRKYADVRLVFAPEFRTAYFGGDPDNFNFPRYDLDISFVRLYENGRAVATPGHLRWNPGPPRAGEPVFVAGDPGGADRLQTADQLLTLRNVILPQSLALNAEFRGRLIRFGEEDGEHQRVAAHQLIGVENGFKVEAGQFQALSQPGLLEAKQAEEAALKRAVAIDPALAGTIGDPWREIAAVQGARAQLAAAYLLLEQRAGYRSELYGYARDLVRAAVERGKSNGERLPQYGETRLPLMEKRLLDARPVDRDLEQLLLEFWLAKVREHLTIDAPETKAFLGGESPETLSRRLAQSRLGDAALRKALWEGGLAAIQGSDDPMIRYVLATDATARAVRRAYEQAVQEPTDRAAARIARARFAVLGDKAYPEPTFSPRLSYGRIDGWTLHGVSVAPFSYFGGLWSRVTGEPPFDLPQRWLDARDRLDPATVFDISTTNDIVGGNSGSPLLNARGEVIGAVFDGNIHSLAGDFAYDGALNRSVAVSAAAATEALAKVYSQDALVRELMQP